MTNQFIADAKFLASLWAALKDGNLKDEFIASNAPLVEAVDAAIDRIINYEMPFCENVE